MKIACGTDIIEIERIKENIENLGEKFLNKIYTKQEIQYCESKKVQKYQSYAARFAVKEAAFKAISFKLKEFTLNISPAPSASLPVRIGVFTYTNPLS